MTDRKPTTAETAQTIVADVLAEWGVRSLHGSWSDRETQMLAARHVLGALTDAGVIVPPGTGGES